MDNTDRYPDNVLLVGVRAQQAGFAELLRRYRLAAGLTQEALAERSRLSVDAVGALERGRRRAPHQHTVAALSDALDLSTTERAELQAAAVWPRRGRSRDPSAALASKLPLPPIRLHGRQDEIASALALLRDPDIRLLALTGPAGVGKTRLALAVASLVEPDFPDGARLVSLAALADPALVGHTIAQALGLREAGRQPIAEALLAHLRERRLLLVLDNFEHLLPASGLLADLVGGCPSLRLLVTTRAALRIRSEHQLLVPPLPTPDPERPMAPGELARVPSVALFVDRARAGSAGFQLTRRNAAAVGEICRRLDGLPLALELAAAWVKLLDPESLLARLDQRLPMLEAGSTDLPERQRTMRAAIRWSYELLEPAEQALFRRLAIFAGGGSVDAVEAVCSVEGAVLPVLGQLLDKNLVLRDPDDGEPRVVLLETIREYGRELLEASGEREAVAAAHLSYCMDLAAQAERGITGREQTAWLSRLARDLDNIRAAMRQALEGGDAESGLLLASRLLYFWDSRGLRREGLAWVDRLLASGFTVSPATRATALYVAGNLASLLSDIAWAGERYEASLALCREMGDAAGVARALAGLGYVAARHGDVDRAVALNEECLALRRALGERRAIAIALDNLAVALNHRGDYGRALVLLEESLAIQRGLDDDLGIVVVLNNLGETARAMGDHDRAVASIQESVAMCRERGHVAYLGSILNTLGDATRAQGDLEAAALAYGESLEISRRLGEQVGVAICVEGFASVAQRRGQMRRAARLYGAAAGIRERVGIPQRPAQRADHEGAVAATRRQLGEVAFVAAWAAGRRLTVDEAVDEATAGGAADRGGT